jgi:hypothetical protein
VATALYALCLVTAAFGHHDLVCHIKTPQHCAACTSSHVGSNPQTPVIAGAWTLADAGRAFAFGFLADGFLLASHTTGRSPPSAA